MCHALPVLTILLAPAPMALAQGNFTNGVNISDADVNIADLIVGPCGNTSLNGYSCVGFNLTDAYEFGAPVGAFCRYRFLDQFQNIGTGGVPDRDWTLLVNDNSSGGLERFSIRDNTEGTIPSP